MQQYQIKIRAISEHSGALSDNLHYLHISTASRLPCRHFNIALYLYLNTTCQWFSEYKANARVSLAEIHMENCILFCSLFLFFCFFQFPFFSRKEDVAINKLWSCWLRGFSFPMLSVFYRWLD